jgi:hypothetical protein
VGEKERIDAFSHKWADYPSSLFQPDVDNPTEYSVSKGNMADFVNALQVTVEDENNRILPYSSDELTAFCIEMMASVQQFRDMVSKIFDEL